jgi:DNA-binding protein HU-beta
MEVLRFMKKKDLVSFVAGVTNISKKDAGMCVDAVIEGIRTGLIDEGEVALVGFGSFKVKDKPAHTGRNPLTGESIEVPEKRVLKFKAAKDLKDSIQ